ncbi:N-acetylmuramoyl-L-alanine amidase, partial [bacterium]|nr:N-acetylmuramoyl-L-alanine amidase [bacterium]
MVPETRVAYHAGKSGWRQFESLNQNSIGIEIINLDGNLHPYPAAQKELVAKLCADILRRNPSIAPTEVLAHSDIAVGRKIDPGLLFPWSELAARGIGAWPLPTDVEAFTKSAAKVEPARREADRLAAAVPGEEAALAKLQAALADLDQSLTPLRLEEAAAAAKVETQARLVAESQANLTEFLKRRDADIAAAKAAIEDYARAMRPTRLRLADLTTQLEASAKQLKDLQEAQARADRDLAATAA